MVGAFIKSIPLLLLLNSQLNIYAQEFQEYQAGYLFKNALMGRGMFYFVDNSGTSQSFRPKGIHNKLKGIIVSRNKDTLFIKFWPIDTAREAASLRANTLIINSNLNDSDFVYVMSRYNWINNKFIDLPFRSLQLTATNLPFRVLASDGNLETDFLNANVAFIKIFGHTRMYKSEFVKFRNRYYGIGPYIGLTAIENMASGDKDWGLNYGLTNLFSFQNLNVTAAIGGQNGFNNNTKEAKLYFGFGIGFKLVEIFTPEIKNKDD